MTSTDRTPPGALAAKWPSGVASITTPASSSKSCTAIKCDSSQPRNVNFPPVIAAAIIKVPASMRSGITL